ncbi:MAG TPA: hypothetical protein VNH42_02060, partial [Mariprofundaceae bacterium]|nr:hypothetical protein [Mariprofundaceae bacterium]
NVDRPKAMTLDSRDLAAMVRRLPDNHLNDRFIRQGVDDLQHGDYVAASRNFNRALKFDPANPNLHFLNALTYHLRAEAGDASQYDLAKAGYDITLRYDPGNYWAAYLQGEIMMRQENYRRAQDAFAYALLNAPNNVTILKALACASYFAQDLNVATKAIKRAAELAPNDDEIKYNQILINAAAGRFGAAEGDLSKYRHANPREDAYRMTHLVERLGDWRLFYKNKSYLRKAQYDSGDPLGGGSGASNDSSSGDTGGNPGNGAGTATASHPSHLPKMVLVDVVIIRSEEDHSTGKGVNLLSGLSMTLNGTLNFSTATNTSTGSAPSKTGTFTWNPTATLSSIAYSLNIFNDAYNRNEVLARPTLVALDGEQSNFFSGTVWHVEIAGSTYLAGSLVDEPVGIKVSVTPNFLSDDEIQFNVNASREFLENQSPSVSFNSFAQTTKNTVSANVVLKYNETLVLSGLSERETQKQSDGVPLLQDIPGIQYLFSHQSTLDYTRSVLILLTPRKPRYTYADGTDKIEPMADRDVKQPNLKELERREGWFRPASNLDAVFYHLRDGSFFREFRQGDLAVERWNEPHHLKRMIINTLNFLYY